MFPRNLQEAIEFYRRNYFTRPFGRAVWQPRGARIPPGRVFSLAFIDGVWHVGAHLPGTITPIDLSFTVSF